MIRGVDYHLITVREKVENTYVVVTANLQAFDNLLSVSVGTSMLQPLGASVSEFSWEMLLCTRAWDTVIWL